MWLGRMSLRKIWTIIRHLPPGSAVSRAVDPEQWRLEHHMLADVYDLVAIADGVHVKDSKTPIRYERPAMRAEREEQERKRAAMLRDDRGRFARQLAAGGDVDG